MVSGEGAPTTRRMMEEAGFADVSVPQFPANYYKLQLVRGVKMKPA